MAKVKGTNPAGKAKTVSHKSATTASKHTSAAYSKSDGGALTSWSVPKGKDVRGMTRDASRQVIKNYGPALEKLKRH